MPITIFPTTAVVALPIREVCGVAVICCFHFFFMFVCASVCFGVYIDIIVYILFDILLKCNCCKVNHFFWMYQETETEAGRRLVEILLPEDSSPKIQIKYLNFSEFTNPDVGRYVSITSLFLLFTCC